MEFDKKLIKFVILLGTLLITWFIAFEFFIKPDGRLDNMLSMHVTDWMCRLLNATGYDTYYLPSTKLGDAYVYFEPNTKPTIRMGASCNGFELLVLFTFFVIAYPGKWYVKIPYILLGNLLVDVLNVIRSYFLTIMAYNKSPYFDLFHRYILLFLIYSAVFGLWMLWANYFSKLEYGKQKQ